MPAYRDYLRKRGRICIQTGFSDAGRYMGQPAACALIEKIRLGMAERAGGARPDRPRADHLRHPRREHRPRRPSRQHRATGCATTTRRRAAAASPPRGIRFRQETSFQGGDGYLLLPGAGERASRSRPGSWSTAWSRPRRRDDPFYVQQDYVDEFFAAVEQFNKEVIDEPLLRLVARRLRRQHALPGGLTRACGASTTAAGQAGDRAPVAAPRDPAQQHPAAAGHARQHHRRRGRGRGQGPRAVPAALPREPALPPADDAWSSTPSSSPTSRW